MSVRRRILTCLIFFFIETILLGCEVRQKPLVHMVEYRSDVACVPTPKDCPWSRLEEEAKFSALVNCLLQGANVLKTELSDGPTQYGQQILAPTPPTYGYERNHGSGENDQCPSDQTVCVVGSQFERKLTWAGCGTGPLNKEALRGGTSMSNADNLSSSVVITASLAESTNTFKHPQGKEGPDHFYKFTLSEKTRLETAVSANSSDWSRTEGHQAAWQPSLLLLAADGETLDKGFVWRAGVTYLFPRELNPGTYYLVVDSSSREFQRGDGLYRLYFGLNRNHLGPITIQ